MALGCSFLQAGDCPGTPQHNTSPVALWSFQRARTLPSPHTLALSTLTPLKILNGSTRGPGKTSPLLSLSATQHKPLCLVCRQRVCWRDRSEDCSPGEQPAHPAAPQLPLRQAGDPDALQERLALQLPAGTSAQVRHRSPPPSLTPRGLPGAPRAVSGRRGLLKAASSPAALPGLPRVCVWCEQRPRCAVPLVSSLCSSSSCPRWLKGNRTRTEDTCSTPAQYRGQSIRDTPALRACKLPTKRSRKGSRH